MNIKNIFKSTTFMVIIMLISIILCAATYYRIEYKPKADAKRIESLTKKLVSCNYNPRLANQLINPDRYDYRWININLLHTVLDTTNQWPQETPFIYYTKDGYKVSYRVRFRTSKKFFKLDVNTQINILTNIYNVCDHHFQNGFELKNIFYKDSQNELVDKDKKFISALLCCIEIHINDNNHIFNTKDINFEDISDSFDDHDGIGVIDISDITIKKDDTYKQINDDYNKLSVLNEDKDLNTTLTSAENEFKKILSIKDFTDDDNIFISYNTYKAFCIDFNN